MPLDVTTVHLIFLQSNSDQARTVDELLSPNYYIFLLFLFYDAVSTPYARSAKTVAAKG
jgi:hypothetical protein